MSNISKPVDWEVFNIPPIKPVQYFSILAKKREFSQLIERYNSQVFKHGYLHYCGIVPKNTSSSLNNRYEIFVLFFDETPNTSFIGFRVKVSDDTFLHESNSLLLFLKRSNKATFYSMNNNCIHVHCGTNAWELFYLLYDYYLRRYVITIIGTQFFYHFVYSRCIQREKQLLEMLHKGSKIIRVSKLSIYYKIHRKRKISVTDLIHMTLNMPKSKKYTMSCFDSKMGISDSDLENNGFYTVTGSKINVSELMLKKYKNQNILFGSSNKNLIAPDKKNSSPLECAVYQAFPSQKEIFSNAALKRKFDEIENDGEPGPLTPKCFKSSTLLFDEKDWEQYETLEPYAIKDYSLIPCTSSLVPDLLRNTNSSHYHSCSHLLSVHSSAYMPFDKEETGDLLDSELLDPMKHHEVCSHLSSKNVYDTANTIHCSSVAIPYKKTSKIHSEYAVPTFFPPNLSEFQINYQEKLFTNEKNQRNENLCDDDDMSFTTAAGKAINVSTSAMIKAHELITKDFSDNEKIFAGRVTSDVVRYDTTDKINYPSFSRDSAAEDFCKISYHKVPHSISLRSSILPEQFRAAISTNTNFDQDDSKDFDFSTAAGRTINISSAAMKAAQKLIEDVSDEGKKPKCNENMHLHSQANEMFKEVKVEDDIASTSSDTELEFDNALIEKFFEDENFFEERDYQITDHSVQKEERDAALESKNNLPSHKPRKSLGGRRSMRYFPDKGSN